MISLSRKAWSALVLAAGVLFAPAAEARIESNLSFTPAVTPIGTPSRVAVTIQNSDTNPATGLSYDILLPAGLRVHDGGQVTNSCGGAPVLDETSGQIRVTMSGGTVPGAEGAQPGICALGFNLAGTQGRTYVAQVPAGTVTATINGVAVVNGTLSQSSLDVTVTPLAVLAEAPLTRNAKGGQAVPISYRFTNSNAVSLTQMGFDIDMGAIGREWLATGTLIENSCGGTFSVTPGTALTGDYERSSIVRLRGGALAANASCVVSYMVRPARKLTASNQVNQGGGHGLSSGLVTTDQGITNAASNGLSMQFRTGIFTTMTANGQPVIGMDVMGGEEADVVLRLANSNAQATSAISLPITVPAGIEMVSTSATCGALAPRTGGLTWNLEIGAAPSEPASPTWATTDCTATIRVRATTGGTHVISVPSGSTPVHYVSSGQVTLNANASAIGVDGGFLSRNVKAPDSLVFRMVLKNNKTSGPLENVTLSNPVQARMPGTVIGPKGVVENTCTGAQVTVAPGRTGISFGGIQIPAGGSCVLAYQVTFGSGTMTTLYSTVQARTNTIGPNDIAYRNAAGNQVTWAATLTDSVTVTSSLAYAGTISPRTASSGSLARLSLRMIRTNTEGHGLRDIEVGLPLVQGIVIDANPDFRSTCGGTLLSTPGEARFRANGGQLPFVPGQLTGECTFSVNIRLPTLNAGETKRDIYVPVGPNASGNRTHFWAQDQNVDGTAGYVASHSGSGIDVTVGRYSLGLGLEFADASVSTSGTTRVLVSLSNAANASLALRNVSLDMNLGASGVTLAAVPDPRFRVVSGSSSACSGASFTPLANGMRLSGATIAAGAVCQMEFSVTASQGGNRIISVPAGAVTSTEGATNSSDVYATLSVGYLLSVAVGFNPSLLAQNEITAFTVEISNTLPEGGGNNYTGASPALTVALPTWFAPSGPPTTTCPGATASAAGNTLQMTGGSFAASASCRVSMPGRVATTGNFTVVFPANTLRTVEGATNARNLDASLRVLAPPAVTLTTTPPMTGTGRIGQGTIRVRNPNSSSLNPEGFSDLSIDLRNPGPLAFVPASTSAGCTGFSVSAGPDGILQLRGITLAAGASCNIVVAATSATAGLHEARTTNVRSAQFVAPSLPELSVPWRFVRDPLVRIVPQGAPESQTPFRLVVEIENTNEVAISMNTPAFTLPFPHTPADMTIHGSGAALSGCTGSVLSAVAGSDVAALSGGQLPAGTTCRIEIDLVASQEGSYLLQPDDLVLQYGRIFLPSITITVSDTPVALVVDRSIRVLAEDLHDLAACASLDPAQASGTMALPGSCLEISISIRNPSNQPKAARNIEAQENLGQDILLAGFDPGDLDALTETNGQLAAEISALAPGEARSFSYRALVR